MNKDKIIHDAVNTILENPYAFHWTVSGLGMLRMYFSEEVRLHVWHSSLLTPNVTHIHTHPWDFTSRVISGTLVNKTYMEEPSEGPLYYKQNILCGVGTHAITKPEPVRLWNVSKIIYTAGGEYCQKSDEIHSTSFSDGTVTIIERTFGHDRDHADVYYQDHFVSAEPRDATNEEINLVIGTALWQAAQAA